MMMQSQILSQKRFKTSIVNLFQSFLCLLGSSAVAEAYASVKMSSTASCVVTKHKLFDMPVSNNGARCRIILYKKQIPESEVSIVSPMHIGGLRSEEYLALNPQGKMPLLTAEESGTSIPESDTICRYLMFTYNNFGPSFQPNNPKSNLIARLHDMYL